MKIIILGSGLLGVSTAYELGKRGFEVTVLERQKESAAEASYSNGGQLSYTHAEPWASPAMLHKLPGWIFRSDSPVVFRPRADWAMIKWGLAFLRNCTNVRARVNCINMLRLGLYSRQQFEIIRSETGVECDYSGKGIIHIFDKAQDFDQAKRQNDFQAKFGGDKRELTREQCLALEPSLAATNRHIIGGLHAYLDENADAYTYCNALAKFATDTYGVKFHYGVNIRELKTEDGNIAAVITDKGDVQGDAYVMALGCYSPLYLKPLGIHLPIYPMKGYSITIDADDSCPQHSITDGSYKIVYSRLGKLLRVAGTAEFAGYHDSVNPKRIAPIVRAAKELFPHAKWDHNCRSWGCLRPSTPDGPPIIGYTPYPNLFLNTGHGTLGWTQAPGSATIVADAIEGKPPGIMMQGLTMERYL